MGLIEEIKSTSPYNDTFYDNNVLKRIYFNNSLIWERQFVLSNLIKHGGIAAQLYVNCGAIPIESVEIETKWVHQYCYMIGEAIPLTDIMKIDNIVHINWQGKTFGTVFFDFNKNENNSNYTIENSINKFKVNGISLI